MRRHATAPVDKENGDLTEGKCPAGEPEDGLQRVGPSGASSKLRACVSDLARKGGQGLGRPEALRNGKVGRPTLIGLGRSHTCPCQ